MSGSVITGPSLSEVWPEVSRRLQSALRRRGASADLAADISQEVAVRVISHGVAFVDARDLLRWSHPVALHLLIDEVRRRTRLEFDSSVPDRASSVNVEHEVDRRIAVERLFDCWPTLSEQDRCALLPSEPTEALRTRQETIRLAVRRHRARARLATLMQGVLGLSWPVWWFGRRESRRVAAVSLIPIAGMALSLQLAPTPWDAGAPTPPLVASTAHPQGVEPLAADSVPIPLAEPVQVGAVRLADPTAPLAAAGERSHRRTVAETADLPRQGPGVRVQGRDREPSEPLVCARGVPAVSDTCVFAPARILSHGVVPIR